MSIAAGDAPALAAKEPARRVIFARLVTHYWSQAAWLEGLDDGIVRNAAASPASRAPVDGRLGVRGPPHIAWRLAQRWPDAERHIIGGAGHGHGVEGYVVAATDRFAAR